MSAKYNVEIEFLAKAIAALAVEDTEEAAHCIEPAFKELKRLNRIKGFNEEAKRMRKRDAAHADAVRDTLKSECQVMILELGGPDELTFAACSTSDLYTLRDELRAMQDGNEQLSKMPSFAPYLINFGEKA